MDRSIEKFASIPPLESIEHSVKSLKGVLSGRKVQASAQNETRALFGGLLNSLEFICNDTIANSDTISLEKLRNSYNKIDKLYGTMREVGETLSVETSSVAQQVDALFFLIESRSHKD